MRAVCALLSLAALLAAIALADSSPIDKILARSKEINGWLLEVRRHLHKIPELGSQEYKTSRYILRKLEEFDIRYT